MPFVLIASQLVVRYAFDPLEVRDPTKGVENLKPIDSMPAFDRRRSLLEEIEQGFLNREQLPAGEAHRKTYQRAAGLMHSAKARAFVERLPHGLDEVIGERGVRISGGQRQRLGIARALYHDPAVLILDEATSDIDNVTEAHIGEAIQDLAGRKTLIIIAHRLATIRRCDRIFLLEAGEIVASGSYDELAATSIGFRRLAMPAAMGVTK